MNYNEQIKFFDETSKSWDNQVPELNGNPIFEEWFSQVGFKAEDNVIDFGCGTGRLIPRIWDKIKPDGKIFAVDISNEMLNVAKKKYPNIPAKYICETPDSLPIPDETIDVVLMLSIFPHLHDPEKELKQISSKLKKNGELWIAHIQSRSAINDLHKNIGGAVKNHIIPEKNIMLKIIDSAKLSILKFIDTNDRYIIFCKKN